MIATAFELLVLDALQQDRFDSKGIEKIEHKIKSEYGNLHQILDCKISVNKHVHFPRKRTPKTTKLKQE